MPTCGGHRQRQHRTLTQTLRLPPQPRLHPLPHMVTATAMATDIEQFLCTLLSCLK
eukprot:m.1143388 g.1143388  ORF g.1143388 m.1143388 type:complete len:56 (+) comp24457_c0_seq29:4001-4168(+)